MIITNGESVPKWSIPLKPSPMSNLTQIQITYLGENVVNENEYLSAIMKFYTLKIGLQL